MRCKTRARPYFYPYTCWSLFPNIFSILIYIAEFLTEEGTALSTGSDRDFVGVRLEEITFTRNQIVSTQKIIIEDDSNYELTEEFRAELESAIPEQLCLPFTAGITIISDDRKSVD